MGLEPKKCPQWQPLGKDEGLMQRQLLAKLGVALARARVEGTGAGDLWNWPGGLSGLRHDRKCSKLEEENRDAYIC